MTEGTDTVDVATETQVDGGVDVMPAQFPPAADRPAKGAPAGQIDILLDTSMSVTACMGQVEVLVRDLLQLSPGSVLTLDRQVGQPVDLYLRGIKFATADLVVVGQQLGVRIKEILPPQK